MQLTALEKKPSIRWPVGMIVLTSVTTLASMIVLQELVEGTFWFANLFILPVGLLICALIAWSAFISLPFRHIETGLNAASLELLISAFESCEKLNITEAALWLKLGDKVPLTPQQANHAILTFLKAHNEAKTNGLAKQIEEAGHATPVI